MARLARLGARTIAVGVAAACLTAVFAQNVPQTAESATYATLPESNEALLFTSRIEDALKAGEHRVALELVERLKDISDGVVASPASRTYYPVWRQVFRLLDRFPGPAVDLYRRLNDPEVTTRFAEAASRGDLDTLRELFRDSRLSSIWNEIGVELATRLLDDGLYGAAIETLLELDHADGGNTPETRAQLVAALARAGAVARAETLMADLLAASESSENQDQRERLEAIGGWLDDLSGRAPASTSSATGEYREFRPRLEAGAIWTQSLVTNGGTVADDRGDELARVIGERQMLPLLSPELAEGALAFRVGGRLWVYDARTLAPRWSVTINSGSEPITLAAEFPMELEVDDDSRLSLEVESVLRDYLGHAVAIEFGLVLTIERGAYAEADPAGFLPGRGGVAPGDRRRNELVARDLAYGHVVWRTGGDPSSSLYDVAFQNVPVSIGRTLAVPVQRDESLSLAVIDPASGELTHEVSIVGPPTHFTRAGGRCLLAQDETSIYVCTGNGVIAALGRGDLSWKWAAVYPSTLARLQGQLWWQPAQATSDSSIDQPVVVDDLLIVAPLDADEIIALDRFDGVQRWSLPRGEYPYLIGATRRGLIVGGQTLACLDLNDPRGRAPLWKSAPFQITGRSAIRDNAVFTPTRDGVVMIDGDSGKIVADQYSLCARGEDAPRALASPSDAPEISTNLVASADALFGVAADRIVKYPDPVLARIRCDEATPANGPEEVRVALERSWLDVFAGDYSTALARMSDCRPDDVRLIAARDQLLTRVYLGLAQDAAAGDDRLAWLQKAVGLASADGAATPLAVAIGRTLEQAGRWDDALRHYGEMLAQEHAAPAIDAQDPDRRAAQWLLAAQRIRDLSDRAAPESLERLLLNATGTQRDPAAIASASGGSADGVAKRLQRLRVAVADGPMKTQIDRLLCASDLPPEMKIRFLADAPDGAPTELRRRLLLEKWDVHASLGMLDAARADGDEWRALNIAALSGPEEHPTSHPFGAAGEEPSRRVESIELALRKLSQASGEPFSEPITRQWKAEHAELILDPRRISSEGDPWLLVADLDRRQIQLINSYVRQQAQRQTEDYLTETAASRPLEVGSPRGGGPRQFWPAAVDGQLAAVPARGGLVCVGMGPERYAGRRQWEYAVPEWEDIPAAFIARSAAGSYGVYFSPRRDRVAMVGWSDGELWWRRDLPGVTIDRLHLVGGAREVDERLFVVSDDRRIWAIDALDGQHIQSVDIGTATPRRIDLVGDRIVVWGPDFVVGVDAHTLERVWTKSVRPVADSFVLSARPWLAFRTVENEEWRLLNVARGEPVFERSLGEFAGISAVAEAGGLVLVGGFVSVADSDGDRFITRLTALNRETGDRLWTHDIESGATLNDTQLTAHERYIPVLLTPGAPATPGAAESELPAIVLVDKHNGGLSEPISIRSDFRAGTDAACEMSLIATSSRIIVQVGGNLIAYGQSPLRRAP